MSYDIQTNPVQVKIISPADDDETGPFWLNVQDDTDYILNRTVVFYPCDNSALNDAEKSVVF